MSARQAAGRWRLDLGGAGGDRRRAAAHPGLDSRYWSDGGTPDMARIAPASRKQARRCWSTPRTTLVCAGSTSRRAIRFDLPTQVGAIPMAALSWSPRRRTAYHSSTRRVRSVGRRHTLFRDTSYRDDARRYDMGEREFPSLEMAAIGMELMASWGNDAVVGRLSMLTAKLAEGLGNLNVRVPDPKLRAPHILSLAFPKGLAPDLPKKLAAENVHAAPRLGRLRLSPHVYNDEQDVERFVEVFRRVAT